MKRQIYLPKKETERAKGFTKEETQMWLDSVREPKRARGKKGKFLADDPRTKEFNEAWVSGKAPKRKRRQGNTREDPRPDKPKARPDRQNRTKQVKTRQNKTK